MEVCLSPSLSKGEGEAFFYHPALYVTENFLKECVSSCFKGHI